MLRTNQRAVFPLQAYETRSRVVCGGTPRKQGEDCRYASLDDLSHDVRVQHKATT